MAEEIRPPVNSGISATACSASGFTSSAVMPKKPPLSIRPIPAEPSRLSSGLRSALARSRLAPAAASPASAAAMAGAFARASEMAAARSCACPGEGNAAQESKAANRSGRRMGLASVEGSPGLHAQLPEDPRRRAEAGEAGLQHVEAGECGQPQPRGVDPGGEREAPQHDQPGEAEYGGIERHCTSPVT